MDQLTAAIGDVSFITTLIADVQTALPFIAGSCLVAMSLGFVFMYIMKLCAGCITWSVILLILLLSSALTYFIYDASLK